MEILDIIGIVATIVTTIAFVPQVYKVYKKKSADDISYLSFLQLVLGASLWTIYGYILGSTHIIISNSVVALCSVLIIVAKYTFNRNK